MWTRENLDDARRALGRTFDRLQDLDREFAHRATAVGGGLALSHESDDAHDYVGRYIDFFRECWQLKDYVARSALPAALKAAVDAGLRKYPMNLCGDLAERSKHGALSDKKRNQSTRIVEASVIDWKPDQSLKLNLEVESDHQRYAAEILAAECMAFWDRHLP